MADVTKVQASDGTIYTLNDEDDYTKDEIDAMLADKADVGVSYTKAEDDTLLAEGLALKADKDVTYTKAEVDDLLLDKEDAGTSYTKSEADALLATKASTTDVDDALLLKADKADTYTKSETDALLADKADVGDSYTKAEDDALLADKANVNDGVPTGVILPFGGIAAPVGYLLCDGSEVAIADFSELYDVISDSFGTASDTDHFVLPDMRECVPKGTGLYGGTVGAHIDSDGLAVGEFLDDRIQNITGSGGVIAWWHSGTGAIISSEVSPTGLPSGGSSGASHVVDFDASRVARTGISTEVKSVGVNYIIKC